MSNVLKFPSDATDRSSVIMRAAVSDAPRAVDLVLSAERQVWRLLSNPGSDNSKTYELALMVAGGNIEDAIEWLRSMSVRIELALSELRSK